MRALVGSSQLASWGMSYSSGNQARWLLQWSTGAQDESLIRSNSVATALKKRSHTSESALKGTNALWNGEKGLVPAALPRVPLDSGGKLPEARAWCADGDGPFSPGSA